MATLSLKLFVAGQTAASLAARANLRRLCESGVVGSEVVVVDVLVDPAAAEADGVLATPTLIRLEPLPQRRIVGDLSDTARVLRALDLTAPAGPGAPAGS